ncbi:hypothetical protein M1615_02785 [Patescibacteria group bacterium]|nr:hypothetical protein [Patescibacteria group bacterium]
MDNSGKAPDQSLEPAEQITVQPPFSPFKPSGNWKWIIFAVVLIFIVILSFSGIYMLETKINSKLAKEHIKTALQTSKTHQQTSFLQNTAVSTTKWKAFSDSTAGYKIRLPSTWNEIASDVSGLKEFGSENYKENDAGLGLKTLVSGNYFSVQEQSGSEYKNYEDYKNFIETNNQIPSTNKQSQEISVDNNKCLLYPNYGNAQWAGAYVSYCHMFYNGKIYDLTFESTSTDYSLFLKILSTFKFTQ